MIFRKKKNYEKIIYVIFLILYVILLLETTLMGRRHTGEYPKVCVNLQTDVR